MQAFTYSLSNESKIYTCSFNPRAQPDTCSLNDTAYPPGWPPKSNFLQSYKSRKSLLGKCPDKRKHVFFKHNRLRNRFAFWKCRILGPAPIQLDIANKTLNYKTIRVLATCAHCHKCPPHELAIWFKLEIIEFAIHHVCFALTMASAASSTQSAESLPSTRQRGHTLHICLSECATCLC